MRESLSFSFSGNRHSAAVSAGCRRHSGKFPEPGSKAALITEMQKGVISEIVMDEEVRSSCAASTRQAVI